MPKTERLYHKKTIDSLFKGGKSKSMTAFPLRLVYRPMEDGDRCEMLVSVPKRNLHRANKRNRVKRQMREAYRQHKHAVIDALAGHDDMTVLVAFIWISDELHPSAEVDAKINNLLARLGERLGGTPCTGHEDS